ncbi:MAG: DUF116 domain-containing protein [Methanobrevibacter sp.]|uniref:DUF116 domain-containing protein n=1 Tax=Methanobrevibacter sp. TaxID=66852 RepID=UPI002B215217|nr:DUF116 domain-containing protein [Methanobrevibacter sp.]MEA4957126.1 DUF116 domain-containing protein [Methanobrevibacter sp.]
MFNSFNDKNNYNLKSINPKNEPPTSKNRIFFEDILSKNIIFEDIISNSNISKDILNNDYNYNNNNNNNNNFIVSTDIITSNQSNSINFDNFKFSNLNHKKTNNSSTYGEKLDNITYNLKNNNSNEYYQKIKEFSTDVLDKSEILIGDIILDYQEFLVENPVEDIYFDYFFEENVLEALYLGVLWKLYMDDALNLDPFYQKILAKLSNLRNKKELIETPYKTQIDEIRGFLATKFLLNNEYNLNSKNNNNELKDNNINKNIDDITNKINKTDKTNKTNKNINKSINNESIKQSVLCESIENEGINLNRFKIKLLLEYLEATGDYKESLKHLNIWKEFLLSKDEYTINSYLDSIFSFTSWFENYAKGELHNYTNNVENFKANFLEDHLNNEDIIFCGRSELEYHINLFGAEVMNEIFQERFRDRNKKAILLPTCMKIPNYNKCKAINDRLGSRCISCSNKCNIGNINENLDDDIPVYVVSHSSSILSNLNDYDKTNISIVGVACINNLIEGGWKISSYNIPPQCVILDYVGCKKHWTPEDIQTNFNFNKLNNIIQ